MRDTLSVMHQGSCLCDAVHYEIDGELGPITFCHCQRCRKANGSAFQAAAQVQPEEFHITQGEDALVWFESSPGVKRVFCGKCGAPLFSHRDTNPVIIRLRLGTLDTKVEGTATSHNFVSDKAEWYNICDDIPQYDERP